MQPNHVENIWACTGMLFIESDSLSLGSKGSWVCEERMLVSGRTPCPWRQVATQYPTQSHGPGPVRGAQRPACHTPEPLCAPVPQSANTTHSHTNILCWFYHNSVCGFHGQNCAPAFCRGRGSVHIIRPCTLGPFWAECESGDEGQHLHVWGHCTLQGKKWIAPLCESLLQVKEFKYPSLDLRLWPPHSRTVTARSGCECRIVGFGKLQKWSDLYWQLYMEMEHEINRQLCQQYVDAIPDCRVKRELSLKTKFSIYSSTYVSILTYSLKLLVMTKRVGG